MNIRKKAAKRPAKRKPRRKVVKLAAFADAPDAKAIMADFGVPAKLANRGIYVVRSGGADWLGKKHPESKLPAKAIDAGWSLVQALVDDVAAIQRELGGACDIGFHADLDAPEMRAAFEAEGFVVERFPFSKLTSIALNPADPWPAAQRLMEAGEVELRPLLDALFAHEPPIPASAEAMPALAKLIGSKADLHRLLLVLEYTKSDLVACALPFVAQVWKPTTAKTKPRGLPPELTTLHGAFDGIPALGVLTAAEIAELRQDRMRLAKDAKGVGTRDWAPIDKAIRIDKFWRDGWIPFCVRKNDETVAIDLEPTRQGQRGQIIGVHLNPPQLRRYRNTLGEWLWNELERAWNRSALADEPARRVVRWA